MGFESFRVELRGGPAKYREADEIIRTFPHVNRDQQALPMKGSTYYLLDDGQHVIEIELRDTPVRFSCRITLCHPASVVSVFLDLIRELMLRLGMEAWICDDVRPEDTHPFSLTHYAEFSAAALRSIASRRTEWIAAFGDEQRHATTNEAHEWIILPRCQSLAAWTGRSPEPPCGINPSHDLE